jgi:hypothetical protein
MFVEPEAIWPARPQGGQGRESRFLVEGIDGVELLSLLGVSAVSAFMAGRGRSAECRAGDRPFPRPDHVLKE